MKNFAIADLVNPDTNPLPAEVRDLVAQLLEGRVASLFIVAEIVPFEAQRHWVSGYMLNMDENTSDIEAMCGKVQLLSTEMQFDMITNTADFSDSDFPGDLDGDDEETP